MNLNSILGGFESGLGRPFRHSNPKAEDDKNINKISYLGSFMTGIACANPKSARRIWVFAILLSKTDYSAAAKVNLLWAEDFMKSEIRGTISDLNREPLKTP